MNMLTVLIYMLIRKVQWQQQMKIDCMCVILREEYWQYTGFHRGIRPFRSISKTLASSSSLGMSIRVYWLLLCCDCCDKNKCWFPPDESVETLCTQVSPVLIITPAAPQGPGSNVKFWLIYSGMEQLPAQIPLNRQIYTHRFLNQWGNSWEKSTRSISYLLSHLFSFLL